MSYLGIEQGLSNNSVRTIYQDHKGFMWFGTNDGLNRYDGYEFKVFRNSFEDTNSLVGNFVQTIAEDKNENIWLGTRKGISVYNPLNERFTTISLASEKKSTPHLLNEVAKDIKKDGHNNMFIATETAGLLLCENAGFSAKQIPYQEENGNLIHRYGVQAISINKIGQVWALVQGKGICKFDEKTTSLKNIANFTLPTTCFAADGDSIWIGAADGLYSFNTTSNSIRKVIGKGEGLLPSSPIVRLLVDKDKKLWVGTDGGGIAIYNLLTRKISFIMSANGKNEATGASVFAIFEDNAARKWIGSLRAGINIIDPQKDKFRTVAHNPSNPNSISGDYVTSFLEASNHSLWVGTDGNGINVSANGNDTFTHYKKQDNNLNTLTNNNIVCIKEDHAHNIWVAPFWGRICRFNKATNGFVTYKTINNKTGNDKYVAYYLYEDKGNVLWATSLRQGSISGALFKYNAIANQFDMFDDSLSDLFTLKEDSIGNLWGGNLSQLVKIDRVNKKHVFYEIGQPVRAIQSDGNGNLWLGTEGGGLVLFDTKQEKIITRYTTKQGLCSNSIISILQDDAGNLWMGTNNGLSRFDLTNKSFKNYYKADGLQSNQFYFNAAIKLRSGAFAFGGIKGYDVFFPNKISKKTQTPPLTFTDILVSGKPIAQDSGFVKKRIGNEIGELIIPYDKAVLSFGFTALEYSSPTNISYAYFMDGWDKDWNYSKNDRSATYTHLPEGHYTFRVKSTDSEGVWNPKELVVQVTVLPPWFRTIWAYLFYLLLVLTGIYIYQQYKNRQTRLKYELEIATLSAANEKNRHEKEKIEKQKVLAELELEKTEHQMEKVLNEKEKELNEKRLSFFTNISHEFRTPLTLIINPLKDMIKINAKKELTNNANNNELNIVYRNARRMLSLVDQLLLFRKAESGLDTIRPVRLNMYNLCNEVYLCFVQQAKSKDITYHFFAENKEALLYADREKMEIILFNLVSNAIKYTPSGGKVSLNIAETKLAVNITVVDNGLGIPLDIGDKLFEKFYQSGTQSINQKPGFGIGLYLAKQFTEAHNGEISYKSERGKGTTFNLLFSKQDEQLKYRNSHETDTDETAFLGELAQDDLVDNTKPDHIKLPEPQSAAPLVREKQAILIVDDENEMREYIAGIFNNNFTVYQANSGNIGLGLAKKHLPDIIISDIKMEDGNGIEFCKSVKSDPLLNHIPVVLLTGTSSKELQIEGVEGGADDYITKPFETELLTARVANLLKSKQNLQKYFFNEVTLNNNKISVEDKDFIENCISIVEKHLDDETFTIEVLSKKMGMSHSSVYKKIKSITGQTLNGFIRFIRLRKAAELCINSNYNLAQIASQVGINDVAYFREQFNKMYGSNPTEYIKKFRKSFSNQYTINKDALDT